MLTPKHVFHVSHNDLDGVGCLVLSEAVFFKGTNYTSFIADNNEVNEIVKEVLNLINSYNYNLELADTLILITDLSVNKEVAEMLNNAYFNGLNVELLDHHKTAEWLAESYEWAKVDVYKCGALLTFERFQETIPEFKFFASVVCDYDLWIHSLEVSSQLNQLLGIIGPERFIPRFVDNPLTPNNLFTEEEETILQLDNEKKERVKKKVEKTLVITEDDTGYNFALGFCNDYVSDLAHDLMNEYNLDYIALVDVYDPKVQLRSNNDDVDVSNIAKEQGGGGHAKAAGFPLNKNPIYSIEL